MFQKANVNLHTKLSQIFLYMCERVCMYTHRIRVSGVWCSDGVGPCLSLFGDLQA